MGYEIGYELAVRSVGGPPATFDWLTLSSSFLDYRYIRLDVFASLPYFLHLSLSRYVDFKYAYAVK